MKPFAIWRTRRSPIPFRFDDVDVGYEWLVRIIIRISHIAGPDENTFRSINGTGNHSPQFFQPRADNDHVR